MEGRKWTVSWGSPAGCVAPKAHLLEFLPWVKELFCEQVLLNITCPDFLALPRFHQKWEMLDACLNWKAMLGDLTTGCDSMVLVHFVNGRRGKPSSSHHYAKKLCGFSRKPKEQAKCHDLLHLWAMRQQLTSPVRCSPFDLPFKLWFHCVGICAMGQPSPAPVPSIALQRPLPSEPTDVLISLIKNESCRKLRASFSIPSLSTWGVEEMGSLNHGLRYSSRILPFTQSVNKNTLNP